MPGRRRRSQIWQRFIAAFGNDILAGKFRAANYNGIALAGFEPNPNQAMATLAGNVLQARKRLIDSGKKDWSLAVLVPTKRMTRQVSDSFRAPQGGLPVIPHFAAVDMEGAILAANVVAFLMQQEEAADTLDRLIQLVRDFYQGKGGDTPSQTSIKEAKAIAAAYAKARGLEQLGKPIPKNSIVVSLRSVADQARGLVFSGNPDADWQAVRNVLEVGACPRLREIASEVRNVRLLDRGTLLRDALAQDWRQFGAYKNALAITRNAFVQEHFATSYKPETGVIVMNMHKAKGKQFDEVIIFEGWPRRVKGEIVSNPDRIVRSNVVDHHLTQHSQNFRVSITRAKRRTTILTPKDDPCVLLIKRG